MFGDESKNKEIILSRLNIAIVDPKHDEYLLPNTLNKKIKEETDKFNINVLNNVEDLYKLVSLSLLDESKSLINLEWIDIVYNKKPSVVLLYYYIKEGSTKEEEEYNISQIIDKILMCDPHIPLYLFVIAPYLEFDKYQHLKDDDKSPNSLRKKLKKKENFYIFHSKNILNSIEIKKLCDNLLAYSRNYYKQVKNVVKTLKKDSKYIEQRIKYSIMIAILSIIKSKKKNPCCSKYLKEAYDLLVSKNFNYKNYYFGYNDKTLLNFYQVKAAADWVLFKILKLDGKNKSEGSNISLSNKKKVKIVEKVKNTDAQFKIDIFIEHIKTFSSQDFGQKENDSFYFYKYFWMYKRYTNLSEFCDDHLNEIKDDKKYLLKVSQIKYFMLYSFIKLMKFYQRNYLNLDLKHTIINNKEIPISSITLPYSSFYGLPPMYTYTPENSDVPISLEYNDDIFLKLTISKYIISLDSLDKILREDLIKDIFSFYFRENNIKKGFEISNIDIANEFEMPGIKFYLNLLRFYTNYPNYKDKKNLLQYEDEKDINFDLYKIFEKSSHIQQFPKIYIRFLNKNVEYFIYQMKHIKENETFNNTKKTILFKSLSILSSIRLLTEEEQDIFNELLNDKEFVPIHYKKERKSKSISPEIDELFVVEENENEKESAQKNSKTKKPDEDKNYLQKYIKETDTLINLYNSSLNNSYYNNKKNIAGIIFDYNIKDINKYQERKILDLVEYEFKISTNLSKLRLKFENIKIFFTYSNQGKYRRYNSEILLKEYNNEFLSDKELTKETPIELEHKIFLKYREGKIKVTKILAKLFNKKDIIYSFDVPNDIQKVIFIKDVSTNVLKFEYKNNFKVGKNQYNPFILQITKEKNDEVEIKDLKIEFSALPVFQVKEFNSAINFPNQNTSANSLFLPNKMDNNYKTKMSQILGVNQKEIPSEKRASADIDAKIANKLNARQSLENQKLNKGNKNSKSIHDKGEKRTLKSAIREGKDSKPTQLQRHEYLPPEFYIYNDKTNKLDKFIEKMKISYNDFEFLLNQGKNKYTNLIRFLSEGSYRIQFSIIYFIRHKKIEDYIEYREDQLLDFEVINPFFLTTDIISNNFYSQHITNVEKIFMKEDKKRYYFTNCKISINFLLNNKLEENIKIKDIEIIPEEENDTSRKYLNSYISDLIHSYDLDPEEKKDMLIMQKNSNYTLPFETEFAEPYQGSIGKINLIWSTNDLDDFENGKLNILNKDEYYFPEMDVRPMDFEYQYKTEKNNNDEIILELSIKNLSSQMKKITVYIFNNNDNYDKEFILIGIDKQTCLIGDNEEIKFNYTLIPIGKGEFDYPCFQIAEYDLATQKKKYINYLYSENIAII